MAEKLTRDYLDSVYQHKVILDKDRSILDEYWDCGCRYDNGIGLTRIRVIDLGDGTFGVEIGQSVEGADAEWASGVFVPVSSSQEVQAIQQAILSRNRIN